MPYAESVHRGHGHEEAVEVQLLRVDSHGGHLPVGHGPPAVQAQGNHVTVGRGDVRHLLPH